MLIAFLYFTISMAISFVTQVVRFSVEFFSQAIVIPAASQHGPIGWTPLGLRPETSARRLFTSLIAVAFEDCVSFFEENFQCGVEFSTEGSPEFLVEHDDSSNQHHLDNFVVSQEKPGLVLGPATIFLKK